MMMGTDASAAQHMHGPHPGKGVLESLGVFLGRGINKFFDMLLQLVQLAALSCGCGCLLLRAWHCKPIDTDRCRLSRISM